MVARRLRTWSTLSQVDSRYEVRAVVEVTGDDVTRTKASGCYGGGAYGRSWRWPSKLQPCVKRSALPLFLVEHSVVVTLKPPLLPEPSPMASASDDCDRKVAGWRLLQVGGAAVGALVVYGG